LQVLADGQIRENHPAFRRLREAQRDERVVAAYLGEPTDADESDEEVLEVLAAEERARTAEPTPDHDREATP